MSVKTADVNLPTGMTMHLQAVGFGNDQLIKADSVLALGHNSEEALCQKSVQSFKAEKGLQRMVVFQM